MHIFFEDRLRGRANREQLSAFRKRSNNRFWVLLLAATAILPACGGSNNGNTNIVVNPVPLTGNWQFTVSNPPDHSFLGGILGGFLIQNGNAATGSALYSVSLPSPSGTSATACNSGSAAISATINGQNVTLTAVAGTQTFTFTGALNVDDTIMAGTYTSTAGTAADGSACGTAQSSLQWSAAVVPPLMGSIAGSFHSTGGAAGLNNQDFLLAGVITQGANTGSSSTTVTGSLGFADPITLQNDYPCVVTANVSGTISGNTVALQITALDGSTLGQIGGAPGSGLGTVTLDSTQKGLVVHSLLGTAYALSSTSCPGSPTSPGDSGNLCLELNSSTACQQPFTLTPASLTFPNQTVGSTSKERTITLTNTSSSILMGLTWTFANNGAAGDFAVTTDTCDIPGDPLGSTFILNIEQSCVIGVTFTPQDSCASENQCSSPAAATLTLTSPSTADNDTAFAIPISGTGVASTAVSANKFDFTASGSVENTFNAGSGSLK